MLSDAPARAMLSRFPLIDGHNDLPWEIRAACDSDLDKASIDTRLPRFHTDIPRLVEGGVGGQWWSVYVPGTLARDEAVRVTLEQVDLVHQMIARYPQRFQLALTADDVEKAFAAGRIASMLGAEGGHSIGGSLAVLRSLHALGIRYMTLTHNQNVGWADSATDIPDVNGLNDFGRDVVREMQRLGMLVDLSHVAVTTMHDALDIAAAPGDLLALQCQGGHRHPAQRPRRGAAPAARERRRVHDRLRPGLRLPGVRGLARRPQAGSRGPRH